MAKERIGFKQANLFFPVDIYERLEKAALKERRSVTNMIVYACEKWLDQNYPLKEDSQ